jgi:heat-inducible transcriptional repressor
LFADANSALFPDQELKASLKGPLAVRRNTESLLLSEVFREVVARIADITDTLAVVTVSVRGKLGSPLALSQLYYNGLANVMSQPEFHDAHGASNFAQLVRLLESEHALIDSLEALTPDNRVIVSIGRENALEGLDMLSIITKSYKGGVLAVIGPTRMKYREAIAAVTTAANVLDELLD